MEFFDKQKDNSKQNEMLLDAIMEKQKQREKKYNIDKGFLIRKNEKVYPSIALEGCKHCCPDRECVVGVVLGELLR